MVGRTSEPSAKQARDKAYDVIFVQYRTRTDYFISQWNEQSQKYYLLKSLNENATYIWINVKKDGIVIWCNQMSPMCILILQLFKCTL